MEHLLVAWQVLSRYCPQAQNVFLGFHYLSSDVTWRVQTGLGPGIVFPAGMVALRQTFNCRGREQTIAMCVYKQSYECLYKAGELYWNGFFSATCRHGEAITFLSQLSLLSHSTSSSFLSLGWRDGWVKTVISSPERGNLHNDMFRQGTSQRVKFLQPWVNPAEVRTSQTTGLTQETV